MAEKNVSHNGPAAGMAVRNSVPLGVFLAVAALPRVPFTVIELAGRGITADAAANRWMLEVGKPAVDTFMLFNKLIDLGEREDQLVELWQAYGNGEVDVAAFEARLAEIVVAMEKWTSIPEGPVEDLSSLLRRWSSDTDE